MLSHRPATSMNSLGNKKGVILIFVLIILVALMGVGLAFWYAINSEIKSAGAELANAQAFYIAEAGRAKARYELTVGGQTVPYTPPEVVFENGTYIVGVNYSDKLPVNQYVTITGYGYIPNSTKPVAKRQVVEKDVFFVSGGAGGGTNLSLNATAHASDSDNKADKANDGKTATKWQSNNTGSFWISMTFIAPNNFNRVVVNGVNTGSYVVQYSNNGTTWTNVESPVENPVGTIKFNAVSAGYMRLNFSGTKPDINELETYGGASLGQGKFSSSL